MYVCCTRGRLLLCPPIRATKTSVFKTNVPKPPKRDPAQVTLGAASFAAVVPLPGAFCHSYAERASQQLFGSCPGGRARVLLPVPGRRPPSG